KEARAALEADAPAAVDAEGGLTFLDVYNTPVRLIIVGAVHIAQPLARLAAVAGLDVTVVDPRTAFAFEGARRVSEWPDEALARLAPDRRPPVAPPPPDPTLAAPALAAARRSPAFSAGCLGSQKPPASRLRRLHDMGFDDAATARLHGPVGLRIGARTPPE